MISDLNDVLTSIARIKDILSERKSRGICYVKLSPHPELTWFTFSLIFTIVGAPN